jgi:hypothetical protein
MNDDEIRVVELPDVYGNDFFAQVFAAAKANNVPIVVIVKGPLKFFQCTGAEAKINVIDRLFGWRGSK